MQRSSNHSSGHHKEPFYFSKWLTFSAAAMLQLSAGLGYTFSIYSNALKTHFKCAFQNARPHVSRCRRQNATVSAILAKAPAVAVLNFRTREIHKQSMVQRMLSRLARSCNALTEHGLRGTQVLTDADSGHWYGLQRRRLFRAVCRPLLRQNEALQLVRTPSVSSLGRATAGKRQLHICSQGSHTAWSACRTFLPPTCQHGRHME